MSKKNFIILLVENRLVDDQNTLPANRFKMYQDAKKIIEARIAFFIHLGIYLAVSALLFLVNLSTFKRTGFWFVWPALFWGAGVLVHGCFVLVYSYRNIRRWQEKLHGRKAMEMLLGLSVHASLFVVINILVIAINVLTYPKYPNRGCWSVWIFLGWGIPLGFHALWFYLNKNHLLKRWKRRKALQLLEAWGGLP